MDCTGNIRNILFYCDHFKWLSMAKFCILDLALHDPKYTVHGDLNSSRSNLSVKLFQTLNNYGNLSVKLFQT